MCVCVCVKIFIVFTFSGFGRKINYKNNKYNCLRLTFTILNRIHERMCFNTLHTLTYAEKSLLSDPLYQEIENGIKKNLFHAFSSKYSIVLRSVTFISLPSQQKEKRSKRITKEKL